MNTCKDIHHHINHLISINTSDEMIIESLKTKFPLKDFNFMDIQHRFTLLKHEYARKKIVVSNHLDNAFRNNDFHDGHKEVVKQLFNSIYNNDITSNEFSEKIKVENDFSKFYAGFLDLIKNDHGEPTLRAYKITDDFVSDRINNSVIEETKNPKSSSHRKRSREDDTNVRSFYQASTSSSSSTPVHPISVPTAFSVPYVPIHDSTQSAIPSVLSVPIHDSTQSAIPDGTELQRNESVTSDDNFDVWSTIVKFFKHD
jgi:hypothetical protein